MDGITEFHKPHRKSMKGRKENEKKIEKLKTLNQKSTHPGV